MPGLEGVAGEETDDCPLEAVLLPSFPNFTDSQQLIAVRPESFLNSWS